MWDFFQEVETEENGEVEGPIGREGLRQLEAELDDQVAEEARSQKAKLAALLESLRKSKPVTEAGAFAPRKRPAAGGRRKKERGGKPMKLRKVRK